MTAVPTFAARVLAAATDPGVVACGPRGQQAWLCSTTYRVSGSKDAAEVADVLAKPLGVAFVVVLALVGIWFLRRFIRRVATRLADPERTNGLRRRAGLPSLTEVEQRRRVQRGDTIAFVLRNVVSVFVWVIATLVILSDFGIDVAPVLAGAGVLTVVIGFGAQTVVRDFLAGLFIVLEDQFGIGDVIDIGGVSGTVEWISLRATRFRDVEGVVWWVPNGEIKRVGNKSQQWARALLDVTIASDSDIGQATQVIQATADQMWHEDRWHVLLLDEPEVWGVEDVGAGGIVVRLVVKTIPHEQWAVARELRARLKGALDDAGIAMPTSTP